MKRFSHISCSLIFQSVIKSRYPEEEKHAWWINLIKQRMWTWTAGNNKEDRDKSKTYVHTDTLQLPCDCLICCRGALRQISKCVYSGSANVTFGCVRRCMQNQYRKGDSWGVQVCSPLSWTVTMATCADHTWSGFQIKIMLLPVWLPWIY